MQHKLFKKNLTQNTFFLKMFCETFIDSTDDSL